MLIILWRSRLNFVRLAINRLKKILLLMVCNVVWDLEVRLFSEQERMALFHCLAVVILSLLVVWIIGKVDISIMDVLEKCGVWRCFGHLYISKIWDVKFNVTILLLNHLINHVVLFFYKIPLWFFYVILYKIINQYI